MSPDHPIRQIDDAEIRRPLVPIGEASSRLRHRLETAGVVFRPDDDPGLPGPSDTAAVELSSGTQFAFEHHHAHPEDFVLVRSERGSGGPAGRIDELVRLAGIDRADIRRTEDNWDGL
jgi:hypothetical protein